MMKKLNSKVKIILVLLVFSVFTITFTYAKNFPTKPITIVVAWAAGGGTDTWTRTLAKAAEEELGQPIVVVNKTGAGGTVGLTSGMNAKPDGYTLTLASIPLSIIPFTQPVPDFFSYKSFEPILLFNVDPGTVTVRADSPWETLEDFLADAKVNPGEIKIAAAPPGGAYHFVAKQFEEATGTNYNIIPYAGAAPAVTALAGGHVDATVFSPGEVLAQVLGGNFRVLGVMSRDRNSVLPEAPTLIEKGIDLEAGSWRGIVAPKGTPVDVIETLHAAFKRALDDESVIKFAKNSGFSIDYLPPKEFGEFMRVEYESIGQLAEELGLTNK